MASDIRSLQAMIAGKGVWGSLGSGDDDPPQTPRPQMPRHLSTYCLRMAWM